MLYNIPIESLEERYSAQWNVWFPRQFRRHGLQFDTIHARTLTNEIKQGSFLDVIGTNYYKANQLAGICKLFWENKVMPSDVFFFHDLWFPGIEMLAYMRDALKLDFEIAGILHAGCWDEHDMLSQCKMTPWAQHVEMGWLEFIDYIFVATEFHKKLICDARGVYKDKIYVTGLPIYTHFVETGRKKEDIVVFPHRLDPEKQPELFDKLTDRFAAREWSFLKTKVVAKSKRDYYRLLNESKVSISFAQQETWGIAMIESVLCGCIPLVPNRLSYKELYPMAFRYEDMEDLEGRINQLIENPRYFQMMKDRADTLAEQFTYRGQLAIDLMLGIIGEL